VDPHEFEPAPADLAALEDADLVVANGLGYDDWALDAGVPVGIEAGAIAGKTTGDDPHLWYGPTHVTDVADGVTTMLGQLAPDAAGYFAERNAAWHREVEPYFDEVSRLRAAIDGAVTFAATESVFEYMADALSLIDITPAGFLRAAASETDPSPGDIEELEARIADGDVAFLIANAQTSGSVSDGVVDAARDAGVPVVEVTETPPDGSSFADWQLEQLAAVAAAVGQP
jgi:zinc/manganese transport system substrate-binding protein